MYRARAGWRHRPAWTSMPAIMLACPSTLRPHYTANIRVTVRQRHAAGRALKWASCQDAHALVVCAAQRSHDAEAAPSSAPKRKPAAGARENQQLSQHMPRKSSHGKGTQVGPAESQKAELDAWSAGVAPIQQPTSPTGSRTSDGNSAKQAGAPSRPARQQRAPQQKSAQGLASGQEQHRTPGPTPPPRASTIRPQEISKQRFPQQRQHAPELSRVSNKNAAAGVPTATVAATATAAAGPAQVASEEATQQTSVSAEEHEAVFKAAVAAHQLNEQQVQQLLTYLDYMLETNKVMNLTAVRDRSEALVRHVVDSLAILPVIEDGLQDSQSQATQHADPQGGQGRAGAPLRVIDVGTGAGLPGMVLAIARPQWRVTLLDTLKKRCDFLQRAAQQAGLSNVDVVWNRAEDGARKPHMREAYDVAVARAVADTRVLAELCLPFVKVGGLWVAPKGPSPEAEVAAAQQAVNKLGGAPAQLLMVQSFSPEGQRTAVSVRKTSKTPATYPRSPGTPNKNPL